MIFCPINPQSSKQNNFVPAWDAILRTQKQSADEWLLIAQADHARLAGEMAASLANRDFPALEAEVIQAISVHDDGWKLIDNPAHPNKTSQGRPLSFFEESPKDIFHAWQGSISAAMQIGPLAGILVSDHFCRIARDFAHAPATPPEIAQVLTTFVERENAQQEDLRERQSRNADEINALVNTLQFFDLLSLYICCGSQESIEFPQRFDQKVFRLRREAATCSMEPSLFKQPIRFSIPACKYPLSGASRISVVLG